MWIGDRGAGGSGDPKLVERSESNMAREERGESSPSSDSSSPSPLWCPPTARAPSAVPVRAPSAASLVETEGELSPSLDPASTCVVRGRAAARLPAVGVPSEHSFGEHL
eukprot:CAMPEP_0194328078 /NCGR_PEP_ID=MMETSP0171-20130528/43421_1 /TAXON_ID=218684 /ORGANISM="Corethron pennatum, Strain L29A3" /LENGTH=108 /DNA_ID=CAMNT_0039088285 /DNA_START=116 /DNA_END=440 /DNA_ORIENTATION=+